MNETDKMIENVKEELLKMSNQARMLGIGLENVAPSEKAKSTTTVQYLLKIADKLDEISVSCEALLSSTFRKT